MTKEVFDKLTPHISAIEMCVVHTKEYGHCRGIIKDLEKLRIEFKPDSPPLDIGCSNCIMTMLKEIYNYYKLYEGRF